MDLDALIENAVEAWLAESEPCDPPRVREHKYRGGPPPLRLRRAHIAQERRARVMGVRWEMVDFRDVYARYQGRCGICGDPVEFDCFTIDHIEPIARGGPHVVANLQPAHGRCNARKGHRRVEPAIKPV